MHLQLFGSMIAFCSNRRAFYLDQGTPANNGGSGHTPAASVFRLGAKVLATNSHRPQKPLNEVVVNRDPAVAGVTYERLLSVEHVVYRRSQLRLRSLQNINLRLLHFQLRGDVGAERQSLLVGGDFERVFAFTLRRLGKPGRMKQLPSLQLRGAEVTSRRREFPENVWPT